MIDIPPLTDYIKIEAFNSAIKSIDTKKLVDILEDFGKKEFRGKKQEYLDGIRRKLAEIVYEIGQRTLKGV